MPDVYQTMREYQRRLSKHEAAEMLAMAKRWAMVEKRLGVYFDALIDEIARDGLKTDAQIFRLYRYQELAGVASDEIAQYELWAGERIRREQMRALNLGFEAAVRTAYADSFFAPMIDRSAVANMIGICADGAPLFSVLKQRAIAPQAVEGLTNALIEAVALGYGPRKTARFMAHGLALGLDKALLIARTEQIRVYREATRAGYSQMGVTEYQRHCALSDRTCPVCLALDGKIYKTDAMMHSHPGCRCFMTAIVRGQTYPARAQDWFAKLPAARQKQILGPGHYNLYQGGMSLEEMVRTRNDPVWGPGLALRSVKSLAG